MIKKTLGVALILVDPRDKNRVFVLMETQEKPWKKIGDYAIPMETLRPNESHPHAIARLLDEEVGPDVVTGELHFIGDFDLVGAAIASTYYTELRNVSFFRVKDPEEAESIGFMHYEDLLSKQIRPGVLEMVIAWRNLITK